MNAESCNTPVPGQVDAKIALAILLAPEAVAICGGKQLALLRLGLYPQKLQETPEREQ